MLALFEAWNTYHASAPQTPECLGNIRDSPWYPRQPAILYAACLLATFVTVHLVCNHDATIAAAGTHLTLLFVEFYTLYLISIVYINMVVTARPHPYRGDAVVVIARGTPPVHA